MRWFAILIFLSVWMPMEGQAVTNLIRIGVPWSPGSKGMTDLQTAGRDIAKKSAGRVQVKFVEQLDLDSGPLPCTGALLIGPALARQSPAARIFALPLFFHSSAEVSQLQTQMDATVADELQARGFATITQVDLGFAYLHSTSPLETVAQLKAVKLWVPPTELESIRMLESYGMTLVPLDTSRVREALRQGTVAAAIAPPLGALVLQWHTEVKSVMDAPFVCLYAAVVVRKDALAALDVSDQTLLRDELAQAFAMVAADLRQKEPEALDVLVQNGVARQPLGVTSDQRVEWETWAATVADQLVADGLLSAAILEQAHQTLAGFRANP